MVQQAESVRATIERNNREFCAAFNRGDAAGIAALYTDDAVALPDGAETIRGRQGIQQLWEMFIGAGGKDLTLETVEVQTAGDTAYEIGNSRFMLAAAGEGYQVGKYVVVWKRGADGSWKYAVDIWNRNSGMLGT